MDFGKIGRIPGRDSQGLRNIFIVWAGSGGPARLEVSIAGWPGLFDAEDARVRRG